MVRAQAEFASPREEGMTKLLKSKGMPVPVS